MKTDTAELKKALIVDDEPDLCQLAEITLARMGLDTCSVNDITTAKSILAKEKFDLCLTDMNLPDGNGLDLVEHIQKTYPGLPVAVITAYGNMESAVRALKSGAFDFVSKPIDLQVLRSLVNSAIKLPKLDTTGTQTTSKLLDKKLLGKSQAIKDLRRNISKLARSQAPVFIHGESGCGKELTAQLIHQQGARCSNPFIAVNCGAIPLELMESEFFGHKKGSFTGATTDKDGLFKAAHTGTLFLDEIADLPLQMQVKLLRAIQEKSIRPVGAHEEESIDVRILSASHKNLSELVEKGDFREDLYYRINVIELAVPSLRDRPEDIPELANHLILKLSEKNNHHESPDITDNAMNTLIQYAYPGNVRELENILERAIALTDDNTIHINDLSINKAPAEITPSPEPTEGTTLNLAANEKGAILNALNKTRWNKTAAAKILGITLRQLRYRLEKLNIE